MLDVYSTIAEVGVSLAGFSGLFLAFSRREATSFSDTERFAVLYLLCSSLSATLLALLPGVLAPVNEPMIRALNVLAGFIIGGLAGWLRYARARHDIKPRYPWVPRLLGPVAWSAAALQLAAAFGFCPPATSLAVGLWWLIVAAAAQFVIQVVATFQGQGDRAA